MGRMESMSIATIFDLTSSVGMRWGMGKITEAYKSTMHFANFMEKVISSYPPLVIAYIR